MYYKILVLAHSASMLHFTTIYMYMCDNKLASYICAYR